LLLVKRLEAVHAASMARGFRLFGRYRRPSTGELFGTTQAKRRISRRYHLAFFRDPTVGFKNMQRRAKRSVGYYSEPAKLARHSGCLLPAVLLCALAWQSGVRGC
jgi:hypothetical protein